MKTKEAGQFLPDDPRLTAYALGELGGAELAAVEAALREDAALRAAVEEIRVTVAQLEGALATEALPAVPEWRKGPTRTEALGRAAIIPNGSGKGGLYQLDGGPLRAPLIRFPQFYYVVSGLAAACFVVFVLVRDPGERPRAAATVVERKVYTVVDLSPLEAAPVAAAGAKIESVTRTLATPELVAVPPKTVTFAFNAEAVAEAPSAGGIGKDLSLLGQAGAPNPKKTLAFDSMTSGRMKPPGIFYREAEVSSEQWQAGRTASVGGRGVSLSSTVSYGSGGNVDLLLAPSSARVFTGGVRAVMKASLAAKAPTENPRTESYVYRKDNDFLSAAENPLSTFAADVDTASYANVRRMLRAGQKPPADAVRVEEWVNYFPYRYAAPKGTAASGAPAFAASLEVAEAPWAAGHRLVRIGLKAREVTASERGAANLVFLVDVSGSMNSPERLPLVQESLRLLVNRLRPDDRVAIVTYAGASGLALASTPVAQARAVVAAIEAMTAGGATNGGMGIQLAYDIAKANFVTGGVNRVILCTDGDFNVGVTGEGELVRLVQEKAKSGVFLTVLGFGMGNLKDAMLEAIADKGNGSYGTIDSRREAEKLLGAQVNGTLTTVAKDVKLQVEFNPARVASYRLIGYENRLLANPDFNKDKVDAGEVGAGHTVTALYEIVPTSQAGGGRREAGGAEVDELKYSRKPVAVPLAVASTELLTVKVRYKEPAGDVIRKLEFALADSGARFADASADFKFAGAVAAFAMVLRDSPHKGTATLGEVVNWAEAGAADDPGGWRGEFVELARAADGAR